jgi:hypothetical protein
MSSEQTRKKVRLQEIEEAIARGWRRDAATAAGEDASGPLVLIGRPV